MKGFAPFVISNQKTILQKNVFAKVSSFDTLESPVLVIISRFWINSMRFVDWRKPVSEVLSPSFRNSFATYFPQILSERSVRLQTCIEVVLEMAIFYESIVVMHSKTLASELQIEPFIVLQIAESIWLPRGSKSIMLVKQRFL
jgi:Na+-translocating ferredoxin:NAD+ oxidoreductase RnfD subunit